MSFDVVTHDFLGALRAAIGPAAEPLTLLHGPDFRGRESEYVAECVDTAWVSSVGKFVDRFEQQLAEYTGAASVSVVSNGTSALFVALHMAGVGHNDEVIVPALSFVATANAVSHCGAVPHFVDSSADTLGIDPVRLGEHLQSIGERRAGGLFNRETGRRIAAIVPMHTFGFPVDMAGLMSLAESYGLPVIEDAAESLGSLVDGRHTGTLGRLGVLSFNGNKTITTGGGGAILTNDVELGRRIKHITTTGKQPHRWEFIHDVVAWNLRLPNINAALGCAQMERLEEIIAAKRALAERYDAAFAKVGGIKVLTEPAGSRANYWLIAVQLEDSRASARDAILAAANDAGYQCRPIWRLLNTLPMYQQCPRAPLPVAEAFERTVINVPSSSYL